MPVRNDTKTPTNSKTTTTKLPTPAETKAAEAAAKAKAEEGAEDIAGGATTSTKAEKRLPSNESKAIGNEVNRHLDKGTTLAREDADALAGKLGRLPAADFKDVMNDVASQPGKLEKLMNAMTPEVRSAFITMMVTKGYVGVEPAAPTPSPKSLKAPTPPPAPAMLRDDPKLPPAVRDMIVKEDISRAQSYKESYESYRASYQTAVKNTKSVGELRALGPQSPPASPEHLPGAKYNDPNNIKYEQTRGANVPDVETNAAIGEQMRRLTGRPNAGDISFTLEGKLLLKIGPPHEAAEILGVEGKAKLTDGHLHAHKTGVVGTMIQGAFVETTGHDTTVGYEQHGAGGSVTVGEEGVSAKGKAGGVVVKGGISGENEMSLAAGVSKEIPLGSMGAVEGEVLVGAGVQGVTEEDAEQFASTSEVGFFDTPPELGRGKSWASLPEETKKSYELQGWTEKEWSTASDLEKAKRR